MNGSQKVTPRHLSTRDGVKVRNRRLKLEKIVNPVKSLWTHSNATPRGAKFFSFTENKDENNIWIKNRKLPISIWKLKFVLRITGVVK